MESNVFKKKFSQIKEGHAANNYLLECGEKANSDLKGFLKEYEPNHLIEIWRDIIYFVDEVLNFDSELLSCDYSKLTSFKIYSSRTILKIDSLIFEFIQQKFGESTKNRFVKYHQIFIVDFLKQRETLNDEDEFYFNNIIIHLSKSRLHITAIPAIINQYCLGTVVLSDSDIIPVFWKRVSYQLKFMEFTYFQRLYCFCYSNYSLKIDSSGMSGSDYTLNLENVNLEPEINSLCDQLKYRSRETNVGQIIKKKTGLFHESELTGLFDIMDKEFILYKIDRIQEYKQIKSLWFDVKNLIEGNYKIDIKKGFLVSLEEKYNLLNLRIKEDDIPNILYDYAPFRKICENEYFTTIPLLKRFFDRTVHEKLRKVKRFQIHSGFNFEKKVLEKLSFLGYKSLEIKRLKNQEFDLITEKLGRIYNFQCKNNYIDTYRANQDVVNIGKKNKTIVNRHFKAIEKEKNREYLILEKYPDYSINHYVISRFPLYHNHSHLINFNKIMDFDLNLFSRESCIDSVSAGLFSNTSNNLNDAIQIIENMLEQMDVEISKRNMLINKKNICE